MSKPVAMVTGAGGEMGGLLLPALIAKGFDVVALDLKQLPPGMREACRETVELDITDQDRLREWVRRHQPSAVFHLAAILSSHAERDPAMAHRVNVEGTLGLYRVLREESSGEDGVVRFFFPSSIAAYGLPTPEIKKKQGALKEWQWTEPIGIYGCNKLYCELVGSYLTFREPRAGRSRLDFRSIRFPGLISADTLPTGGTTDYAPAMIHAAAQNQSYASFISEPSRLPFMTMPDAIDALMQLAFADAAKLNTRVYNIRGFSASAGEIREEVLRHFPEADISFDPIPAKQKIVDSWPEDVDDSQARKDWGLAPRHGLREAFGDYLVPALVKRYTRIGDIRH